METKFLDVYNTHMKLYPYTKDDLPILEAEYTATDKFSGNDFICGYMIEDAIMYLPRGTSISKIEGLLNIQANYINDPDPKEPMSIQHRNLYDLRSELQEKSVEFLMGERNSQLGLNLGGGQGKSFCVAYASTELREKTIIITHTTGIKKQWINKTYFEMFDYRHSTLLNIDGSQIMESIMKDNVEPADVYFVNHQTLRSYMTRHGGHALHRFFKKLKVGIKVYDEAHLEFANILLVDFFTNTERTWYLSATFDRSDNTESVCFRRAFSSVATFGEEETKEVEPKHVVYHVVNFNSRATPKQKAKVAGFTGGNGVSYGKYAFLENPNQTAYKVLQTILEKIRDVEGKVLILVPLIEIVDQLTHSLSLDFPEKRVAAYHSRIDKSEKDAAIQRDIIVSTIKSCGTGRDIPELRTVINFEPFASKKVLAKQIFWRLRPYPDGKLTYFFDAIDVSIPFCNWWFKSRFKEIKNLAHSVVYLNLDS